MTSSIDFDSMANEVNALLKEHGLAAKSWGLRLLLPRPEFDAIAAEHPGHHPRMILLRNGNDWHIQIQPEMRLEDFPPGATLPPPTD